MEKRQFSLMTLLSFSVASGFVMLLNVTSRILHLLPGHTISLTTREFVNYGWPYTFLSMATDHGDWYFWTPSLIIDMVDCISIYVIFYLLGKLLAGCFRKRGVDRVRGKIGGL